MCQIHIHIFIHVGSIRLLKSKLYYDEKDNLHIHPSDDRINNKCANREGDG